MLASVTRENATVYHLPGRDWLLYSGPSISGAKNLTVGVAIFPPGSAPPGHIHDGEEEVIYVVSGHGELHTPQGSVALEPGTCVYVPMGLHHSTVSHGPEALELVTSFAPPVVPGSYEVLQR
jgi:mannose-6-phosphate isomerase-like protein (cupin superfamily)